MLLYILAAIFIFGSLIFFHELGHFLTAKACNVRVNEFSVCMGPAIWKKQRGETLYALRCIPIGGYCAMEGENEDSDDPRAFSRAGKLKKLAILIAGSASNFLIGFLILAILCAGAEAFVTTRLDGFYEGVAEQTGLMVGDEIVRIDSERVFLKTDVQMLLERGDGIYTVTVRRDGTLHTLENVPIPLREYEINGEKARMYGLIFAAEEATAGSVLKTAWLSALNDARLVWLGLRDMVNGVVGVDEISGPVGIVSVMAEAGENASNALEAVHSLAYFAAFLSINLAVMNMLPIPALDGGRAFLLLVRAVPEAILRRKLPEKYENFIHQTGMVLLLAFIAWITLKDVWQLFR
ncbi:MAG: site-2 protease family protein [Oscillospiraceae bacterium]|nr:site-2 protease family protein [Oscillospiraceae bacterium]